MEKAPYHFTVAIPLALVSLVLLAYLAKWSWARVALIFTSLSSSVIGSIWFSWLLD